MNLNKNQIRAFLNNDLGLSLDDSSNTSPLFSSGLIDSFALIEILVFLESEFNCRIDLNDLSIDDIDCIDSIANLIIKYQL